MSSLPEKSKSIDERVFFSAVGIWKARRVISELSLRRGVVELWPLSVKHEVRRARKRFIMPLIEVWRSIKENLIIFHRKDAWCLKSFFA